MARKSADIPVGKERGQKKTKKSEQATLAESIHEELENYKFEIRATLGDSIRNEFQQFAAAEIRRSNRRRHWSNFIHDIVIIILAVIAGYFGYELYELHFFSSQKDASSEISTEDTESVSQSVSAGPVKDAAWYLANYQYLFYNLDAGTNADEVSAYYWYSGDRATDEIESSYLLAMAYGQIKDEFANLSANSTDLAAAPTIGRITIPSARLAAVFQDTFGSYANYKTVDFNYGCLTFNYDRASDSFVSDNTTVCRQNIKREIIEKPEKIYAEGEALYLITVAGVYDKENRSFYKLDNLFRSVADNVSASQFDEYADELNRYQYQFKKSESSDNYYFSKIIKLR